VSSYVLIVCTVPLPPGVNPIAVDKYEYIYLSTTVVLLVSLFSIPFHPNLYFADQPNEQFIRWPADYVCELMFYVLIVRNTLKICKFVPTVGDFL